MRPVPSLRGRLVALVGGGLLVLLLGAFLSTALLLDERQEEMTDALLNEQMAFSLQLYYDLGRVPELNVPRMRFWVLPAPPGAAPPPAFARLRPGTHELWVEGKEFHVVVHEENGRRFLLGYDAEADEEEFRELLAILGAAFLLCGLAALAGIHWLSGRALARLETLARAVRAQDEAAFARPGMEAEVRALAEALDDYRARQAVLLAREREFSGHLSHELRTPLSVIRAQAELIALQHGEEPRLAARAGEIMAQVDRMRALIEQLLRLARRTQAPQRTVVALRPLIEQIWHDLAQTGASRTRLCNEVPVNAEVVADPLLLELILRNTIANARLHADGAELHLRFADGVLEIEDHAEGRPTPPVLPEDGEGLGLAILRRACQLLGWQYELYSQPTGTRITLRMPA